MEDITAATHNVRDFKSCRRCTVKSLLKRNQNVRNHVQPSENLGHCDSNWIIAGKLVENKNKHLRRNIPGYLCLKDATGSIPCLISTSGPLVLEKEILCFSWNFLKKCPEESGYLEISEWVLMKESQPENASVDVISSLCASWVLSYRSSIPLKQVNLFGVVDFVTEIFTVHGDPVFIVNLDGRINILVKGSTFLHWQQIIVPGHEYIFTNLRPTTLFKGKPNERPVFVPWKESVVQEHEFIAYRILKLQEYCESVGVNAALDEMMDYQDPNLDDPELFTYQGVVTDLFDGEITLDNKAKFTISFVNAVHKYEHIRPGCHVVFHNVHVIKAKQPGTVQFCCCLRSCVKIEKFPFHFEPGKSYECEKSQYWFFMNKFSLNFHEVKQLSWNYEEIRRKLSPTFSRSTCDESLQLAMKQYKLHDRKARVFLDEVLEPCHSHCVVASETRRNCNVQIPCISGIEKANFGSQSKEKDWAFSVVGSEHFKTPQVLIGWLRGNPVTGQLEFCDQTGAMPCIVSRNHNDGAHQCTLDCVIPYKSFSSMSSVECSCPYPQTWWLGALFLLKEFRLIKEVFNTGKPSEGSFRTFFLFSMTDVTVISVERTNIFNLINLPNLELPPNPSDGNTGPVVSSAAKKFVTSQLMLVIHKDNLVVRTRMNDAAQLHFYVQVCFIGDPCVYEINNGDLLPLDSGKDTDNDKASPSVRFVALLFMGKNVRWYHVLHPECTYRLVHMDSNDVNAFKAKVKSRPLQRVLDKGGIEECLTVRDGAMLMRVGNDCPAGSEMPVIRMFHAVSKQERDWVHEARHEMWKSNHIPEVNSVREILQKRQQSFASELPLLSCEGSIRKKVFFNHNKTSRSTRHQQQNKTLGVSVPGDPSMKLILADPDTGDTLEIVAHMADMSYPLAVMPGTRVRFTKLEQKPAKANFHCRITVASNLAVTAFSDFAISSNETKDTVQEYNLNKLATVYLTDLMGQSCDTSLKLCHCLLTKVFQLHLQLICVGCSMSANDWHLAQECPTCGTCQVPRVKAYAVAQVDDGTHSARVSCSGDVVAQLLSLSATQWKDLQLLVQTGGSVEYSPFSFANGDRPVDKFVETLCGSDHVCRSVSIVAHRKFFRDSQNSCSKRTIKVAGRALETFCLPILHLEALAFLPQDLSKVTNRLLTDPPV